VDDRTAKAYVDRHHYSAVRRQSLWHTAGGIGGCPVNRRAERTSPARAARYLAAVFLRLPTSARSVCCAADWLGRCREEKLMMDQQSGGQTLGATSAPADSYATAFPGGTTDAERRRLDLPWKTR
jgi:hypothetical protein